MEKAKREFRRLNNFVAKHLHAGSVRIPRNRTGKTLSEKDAGEHEGYARQHSLFGFAEDDNMEGFFAEVKFVRECKTHRCTPDQDYAFVDAAQTSREGAVGAVEGVVARA